MIILFSKVTGEIFGTVEGRVHDQEQIDKAMIKPANVPESEVGKYIVSFKPLTRIVKRMQYKQMLNPDTLEIEEVEAGEVEIEEGAGLEMDDQFKEFFSKIESGEASIYKHNFKVNDAGEVTAIIEKPVEAVMPDTASKKEVPVAKDSPETEGKILAMQKQIDNLTRLVKGKNK